MDNNIGKTDYQALRAELVDLEKRSAEKLLYFTHNYQKLPYEHMSKGRQLHKHVTQTIKYLDQSNESKLSEYIGELVNRGVKIKNYDFGGMENHN